MTDSTPKFGQLITDAFISRDAVHVAVIPMRAVCVLQPGQHLQNGIVDPFLTAPVKPGERFWLFLYPGTVTGLRHCWTHPAFPDEPPIEQVRAELADADIDTKPAIAKVLGAVKHRSERDVWLDRLPAQEQVDAAVDAAAKRIHATLAASAVDAMVNHETGGES